MKKILAIALTLALVLTAIPTSFAQEEKKQFKDVGPNHWAFEIINDMVEKGIITGHPDGTFRPNDPVQVDQFLKMILMALSEEQENRSRDWADWFIKKVNGYTLHTIRAGSPGFDFTNGEKSWSKPFIEQARNMGIVMKYDRWGGKFNQPLNREGVAYLASQTMTTWELAENLEYSQLTIPHIKDFDKIESSHREVMDAYIKGIMRGYNDGTFGVNKIVTRAEAVIVLSRIIDETKRDPLKPDVSKLPHAEVSTQISGDRVVVFPTWDTKGMYDSLLEAKSLSSGVVAQSQTMLYFYKDQETLEKAHSQGRDISKLFSYPLNDLSMGLDPSSYVVNLHISTVDGALDKHEEAVLFYLQEVLKSEEDAEKVLNEAKVYLKQLKEDKSLHVEKDFVHKKVRFVSGGSMSGTFETILNIYILEKN